MKYKYAFQGYNEEQMVRAVGRDLKISTKHSINICNHLRHMDLIRAKAFLNDVLKFKEAVPFTQFNRDVGHKRGIGPGRYPIKACSAILKLLISAESNAQFKGLNTSNLIIEHIHANFASRPIKYGRQRGHQMKQSHVEIVLKESKAKPVEKKSKVKTSDSKTKTKTTEKKPLKTKVTPKKEIKVTDSIKKDDKVKSPSSSESKEEIKSKQEDKK